MAKFCKEVHDTLVDAIRAGVTKTAACGEAGVTPSTFRRWLHLGLSGDPQYEAFARDVKAAEAWVERNMTTVIYNAAMGGDWRAAQLYLERRVKEWRPKSELSIEAELEQILDVLERELGAEEAERIFAALSSGAGPDETGPEQVDASSLN